MALDGAKFICLPDSAAAADESESTPAATAGDVAGDSAEVTNTEKTVIEAKGRKFTVGYYMSCDYVLDDPRASGVHCEIQCDAFGRVTIHNFSESHPVSVNGQVITIKRPLFDGSRLNILDRTFLWKFHKSVEANKNKVENNPNTGDEISTPQKLVEAPEQAPNSCPDLKPHRKLDKRFTVHNFAYCINSDDEGNTSSELPSIAESECTAEAATTSTVAHKSEATEQQSSSSQLSKIDSSASGVMSQSNTSQDSADGKVTAESLYIERRSISPEPQPSAPTVASTPIMKLENTPKMNLINCTQNKENKSTEKKRRLLSFCQQSDVVITSFSPRQTGIRTEKTFAVVFEPSTMVTATTPKSVYSTPKSMLSDCNDEGSRDFIDFTTPATSKKILVARALARNSSMHLIDLTTPNKLAPASPRPRATFKCNKTLPSNVKLSTTPLAFARVKEESEEEDKGVRALPVTPSVELSSSNSDTTPQSVESVISVDGSSTAIEISTDDSATPSTSLPTLKTPQRATGQKQLTSTPLRTPQSLMKRAILSSAKEQVRKALSSAKSARPPTFTPGRKVNLEQTGVIGTTPSTSKSRLAIGSPGGVAAAQRRSIPARRNLETTSNATKRALTTSTPVHARGTQNRTAASSASRLSLTKRTSPLHGVRKSFGGTSLSSHISKTRRSIVSQPKRSPTNIGAQLVTKARKSLCAASASSIRSRKLAAAALSGQGDTTSPAAISCVTKKKESPAAALSDTTGNEGKNDKSELVDLSCTFTLDKSLEVEEAETRSLATTSALNITFSPEKDDSIKQMNASVSQNKQLNKTFSPDKKLAAANDGEAKLDITVDVIDTQAVAPHEDNKPIITEHISESFAEIIEPKRKLEIANKTPETSEVILERQEHKVTAEKCLETCATPLEPNQQAVIETLDADEISNSELIATPEVNVTEINEVSPPATDTLDAEVTHKPAGESQGTADFLEEIEYVLNKSDELQQQMCKDGHNTSAVNEEVIELEEIFAENLVDKSDEPLATVNINISVKNGVEENLPIEKEIKSKQLETESNDYTVSAQKDRNALETCHSKSVTSSKAIFSVKSDIDDDIASIDSQLMSSETELASTDLDVGSMETEIVSITSEFEVATHASAYVEKSIKSVDEQEVANAISSTNITTDPDVEKAAEDIKSNLTEPAASTDSDVFEIATAEPEPTFGNVENTTTINEDHRMSESTFEVVEDATKDSTLEVKASTNASQATSIESEKINVAQTEEPIVSKEIQTQCVDKESSTAFENSEKFKITTPPECETNSAEIEKLLIEDTQIICPSESNGNIEKSSLELVTSEADSAELTTIDSKQLLEVNAPTNPVSDGTENLTNYANMSSVKIDDNSIKVDTLINNGDEEKENQIITTDDDDVVDTKATTFEPKTPNLSGIRDLLRTPKRSEATTPRFVGLRNLMRTPKASTSAAAASATAEDDDEQLIGMQALLKTPLHSKIKVPTTQPSVESSTFTPRRSVRRRASANADLTPTRCITPTLEAVTEAATPRRTARRRSSASCEVCCTPQRITRRRSSLSLDNDEAIAAALTPQKRSGLRANRTTLLTECPLAEDMGAIIEEESKEPEQESTPVQQNAMDYVKHSDVVETKTSVPSSVEVIEESICEEVRTQKQSVEAPLKEEEKVKKSEGNANLITQSETAQYDDEQPDENVISSKIATESLTCTSPAQLKKDAKDISKENLRAITSTDVTEERLPEIVDISTTATKTKETAEILDESDYEYGKEVKEEVEAHFDANTLPKTPKTQRKSVKNADSPKTPVMVGVRELLKTPKPWSSDTPKLIGVRDLVRTPKATTTSTAMNATDDEERIEGLGDLVKTPEIADITQQKHVRVIEEESSSSTAENAAFIGMRELLQTPKHASTPQYRGMRELLRTPKASSTPQLSDLDHLMQTPKRTKLNSKYDNDDEDDKNVELDQFFKTPRAKDMMIPAEPASAVLEPGLHSSLDIMTATTEYELHSNSQRGLEDIYKTPVSTRLTNVDSFGEDVEECDKYEREELNKKLATSTMAQNEMELVVPETPAPASNTTTKRNLSAEEAFEELVGERTSLDETPPQKFYTRKHRSIAATASTLSPFSAQDIISDLPKTDIQEWVDSLEEGDKSEEEVTVSDSLLEASKRTHDPIAASTYETSGIGICKDTTEELLADLSAVSSMADPLLPSVTKIAKSTLTEVVDDNETLRPITPVESEISGLNLLDQTNESDFYEPLLVSDSESMQEKDEIHGEEKDDVLAKSSEMHNETTAAGANESMGEEEFPPMFVDSSDSEPETVNQQALSSVKQAESTTTTTKCASESKEATENTEDTAVIELDDSSDSLEPAPLNNSIANKTSKATDLHVIEFANFQAHKNLANQKMRASTPNRYIKPIKPQLSLSRRQSMGTETLLIGTSINLTHEKSRLAKEKANIVGRDEKCIIEVDEEKTPDDSTPAEEITSDAEEEIVELKSDLRDNDASTSLAVEDIQSEFRNFQAEKTIATQGKRAATPDQVNKIRAQKILQARRLTLGAEQHLSEVNIDFVKEKTKLEQTKQLPARIDDCIQEIDDSLNESDITSAAQDNSTNASEKNYINISPSKVEAINSNAGSKEQPLEIAKTAEIEEMNGETAVITTSTTVKHTGTFADLVEPVEVANKEQIVLESTTELTDCTTQNIEAEFASTAFVDNAVGVKIVELTIECSSTTLNEPAIEETMQLENKNEAETSTNAETVASTVGEVSSHDISISTTENNFTENDVFDLSVESPKDPPTINTTQGVIFDLTLDEDVKENIKQQTEGSNIENVSATTQHTEVQKVESGGANKANEVADCTAQHAESDTIIDGEIKNNVATVLKTKDSHVETPADERQVAIVICHEELAESNNLQVTSASENGVTTSTIKVNMGEKIVELPSATSEKEKTEVQNPTEVKRNIEEVAADEGINTNMVEKQNATITEQQAQLGCANEVSLHTNVTNNVQLSENELSDIVKVSERDAETSQTAPETTAERLEIEKINVELPKAISDCGISGEVEENNALSESDEVVLDVGPVAISGSASVNMPQEESNRLQLPAEPVESVIELDSDVEEIIEVPNTENTQQQQTAIETDTSTGSKIAENEQKEVIEGDHVEDDATETTTKPTSDDGEREATKDDAQLTAEKKPHTPKKVTNVEFENVKEVGELDQVAISDTMQQSSQRKLASAEEDKLVSKTELESEILVEKTALVAQEPPQSAQSTLKEASKEEIEVVAQLEERSQASAHNMQQKETATEIIVDMLTPNDVAKVAGECVDKIEEFDETPSDGKEKPAKRIVRKPSRSNKTMAEERAECNTEAHAESEIVIESVKPVVPKSQSDAMKVHTTEDNVKSPLRLDAEEKTTKITYKDTTETSAQQALVVEANAEVEIEDKQQPVKRKVRKPLRSTQAAEGNVKEFNKTIISSEINIEDALPVEEKPDICKKEVPAPTSKAETAEKQLEASRKIELPSTSIENTTKVVAQIVPEPVASVEDIVKPHEETSTDGTQQPAKRRGRKPSRTKKTSEENEEHKSVNKNQTLLEESAQPSGERRLTTKDVENTTLANESAAVVDLGPEKTEERAVHIKANYEVRLTTSTEEKNSVKLALSSSSDQVKVENAILLTTKETENVHEVVEGTHETLEAADQVVEEATKANAKAEPPTDIDDKQQDAPMQRSTRRTRKGSQSSQCSATDEDHKAATTRRRGGRRRAETPTEHSADEATTSDIPATKRRRGPVKATENAPLKEISEVQVDETEKVTVEPVIKSIETEVEKKLVNESEHKKSAIEKSSDVDDVEGKAVEGEVAIATTILQTVEKIETATHNASSTELISVIDVDENSAAQKSVNASTATKRGTSRRRRLDKTAEQAEQSAIPNSDAEKTVVEQTVADAVAVTETINEPKHKYVAIPKRGRRKQTVSESSQTSSIAENIEPHTTQRRRRGRKPTNDESIVDALNEVTDTTQAQSLVAEEARSRQREECSSGVTVIPAATEINQTVASSIADEVTVKDEDTIKTEKECVDVEHHTVAETSKRALTRNKKQLKSAEASKDHAELSVKAEVLKVEPKKETPHEEEEEKPIKKSAATGRTRANRRKNKEADEEEHQDKSEEGDDEPQKVNVVAKTEQAAKTETEQPSTTSAESVGGRRGRRGAAAAATVAINEVTAANKRGTPRGKAHQIKAQLQSIQQQVDTKMEPEVTATKHVDDPTEIEEKKPYKGERKRRGSTAETQAEHADTDAELTETEETEESSTKTAIKRARKRRGSQHVDELQSTSKQESPTATSTKQHSRRKRKDSLQNADGSGTAGGSDEPPKKRPISRKGLDSSLDSSVHESTGVDADANAEGNTSSSSTPQRSRHVPRRAAAAQDRNYDESSDAEAQVDLKRRIEKASLPKTSSSSDPTVAATSKHRSPTVVGKSTAEAMLKEMSAKTASTPILSAATTTRGGRQRKPTARVQQYLEEERAKAETPKKRLLLGSAAGAETPASQQPDTPVRRATRKASANDTMATEILHTPARGRPRNAKALNVVATSEESRSEVEHTHSEPETTNSSIQAEAKELPSTADVIEVIKRPARRGKKLVGIEVSEAQQQPAAPTQETHSASSRGGRAAKAAAAAALIPDEPPSGSHAKARVARARRGAKVDVAADEELQHTDVEGATSSLNADKKDKKTKTAAVAGRAGRGGRRNKQQLDEDDPHSHTSQHGVLEDSEASSSVGLQSQQPLGADADDENEDDDYELLITKEEEENNPHASVKGAKPVGKKRAASSRKVAAVARAADSPAPKRGRRRAVTKGADKEDETHSDAHSERAGSSRSRKVVRFDAATPSSTASGATSVEAIVEEAPAATTAPTKRATRTRRK